MNVVVQKRSLWRIQKDIFPAICRHIRINGKMASKRQENPVFQTALLCDRSPLEVASMFRLSELGTRFFYRLRLDIPE